MQRCILDVRSADEFEVGSLPRAIKIPEESLRNQLDAMPKAKSILVCCQIGSTSNSSQPMLILQGYECLNLLGGYALWRLFHPTEISFEVTSEAVKRCDPVVSEGILDVRGMYCPGPMLKVKNR